MRSCLTKTDSDLLLLYVCLLTVQICGLSSHSRVEYSSIDITTRNEAVFKRLNISNTTFENSRQSSLIAVETLFQFKQLFFCLYKYSFERSLHSLLLIKLTAAQQLKTKSESSKGISLRSLIFILELVSKIFRFLKANLN